MTVKQLIDVLKNFNAEAHVVVSVNYKTDNGDDYEIRAGDIIDPEHIYINFDSQLEIRAIDF